MSKDAADPDRLSRGQQKQLSRDRDAMLLQSGRVSADEMRQRNSFFSALPLKRYKVSAIGGKPVRSKFLKVPPR